MDLFEIASRRHAEITKTAFVGLATKGLIGAAKGLIKRPVLAANVAFNGSDVLKGAQKGVASSAQKLAPTQLVGPTF